MINTLKGFWGQGGEQYNGKVLRALECRGRKYFKNYAQV